jgi:hypothetical protein
MQQKHRAIAVQQSSMRLPSTSLPLDNSGAGILHTTRNKPFNALLQAKSGEHAASLCWQQLEVMPKRTISIGFLEKLRTFKH